MYYIMVTQTKWVEYCGAVDQWRLICKEEI